MNKKTFAVGSTALAVVFAAAACSDTGTDTGTTVATSPATTSASISADEAATHNPADVMFAQMMIPHHSQAIEMSDMLLAKQDIPAEVTALAEQIKAAQRPEIEQLSPGSISGVNPPRCPAIGPDRPRHAWDLYARYRRDGRDGRDDE